MLVAPPDPVLLGESLRPGPNPASALAGGVSVLSSLTPITLQVEGPTTPSTVQAVARLQAADRGLGFRAEFAVDRQLQRLLQPRDRVAAVQQRRGRRAGGAGVAPVWSSSASTVAGVAGCVAGWVAGRAAGLTIAEGGGVSVSSPMRADHVPRRRADDAVDGQPVAGLQPADRGLCFGAEVAVDGEVQRVLQLRDRAHGCAPARRGGAVVGGIGGR